MIILTYKLYQSKKNKKIHKLIDTAGFIWNHIVALDKRYYRLFKKPITWSKLDKHIAKLRNKNSFWLQLNAQTVQEIVQKFLKSKERFFKKTSSRLPKFKKISSYSSIVYKQWGCKIYDNKIKIHAIDSVFKFSKSRDFPKPKRVILKRNNLGEIFVFLVCKDIQQSKLFKSRNGAVGLDFGMKTFLTTSDGEKIENPQFFKQFQSSLSKLNSKVDKKKSGSNNRKKGRIILSKLYKKVSNKRSDFQWKLAHQICRENKFIAIEDLNIKEMKSRWGKKITDLAYFAFNQKLKHVASKYGTTIQKIDRFYPSSKICSECENIKKDLTLKDRTYKCEKCGSEHDRDVGAAINILREGILSYERKNKTSFEASFGCIVGIQ